MKKILLITLLVGLSSSCMSQRAARSVIKERNGKVGIGTSQPDELLTVKGKIHTQEVLVDLEGAVAPDYVFQKYYEGYSTLSPTYKMPSLSSLESYLQKYKHLPGVPSAEELDSEGMNLKEMNLLLLEKIEELTLYTLEQQAEIDALKKALNTLVEKTN